MSKKIIALLLALVMVLGLSAAVAESPITLTYAEVNPVEGTIVGQMATDFKTKVEELSGGSIIIDIQASGVLGSEAQVLDTILGGGDTVDISRLSAFALTSYGCNKAKLLSIPYTFVSRAHYWNFANSELAQEFLNEPQELGLPLRGLFYGEEGFRHFFFKNEVTGIEDLKGMKIRVSDDPVMNGMVNDLGANPTVVAFTELYSALQTGVVDGAEQPIANYKSNAFPEVAPYLILDGHTLGAIQVVITDNAWAKLTEEQQGWIMEAGKFASAHNAEISESKENEVLEQLKADGIHVIEVEDKSAWTAACQNTITSNTSDQAELYQKLVDLQ
ncbi:MAG: TRAP transporter substrate-binding protein [Eubacteriales bacterium]|nr:TRAP transporter substrate-binding protein [Eubacteriales bacterium]